MEGEDQIIKRYIEADCEDRLTLFLSYPPLRNRFIDIDLNEERIPGRIRKREMLPKRVFGLKGKIGDILYNLYKLKYRSMKSTPE